jgi:Domain of unknown function (DUF4145)
MAPGKSKRAELLRRVLSHINRGTYQDDVTQIWFGEGLGDPVPTELLDENERLLSQLVQDASHFLSRRAAIERTPLVRKADISDVSPLLRRFVEAVHREQGDRLTTPSAGKYPHRDPDLADHLDMYYAEQMINKLDQIVARATRLDEVHLSELPARRVQLSFEEAHRCYLYGFHAACAVFCRAILETALREKIHSVHDTLDERIEAAENAKLLTDDRPSCAHEVVRAGNVAIHDPAKFEKHYPEQKVEDILFSTRKILEQLYDTE